MIIHRSLLGFVWGSHVVKDVACLLKMQKLRLKDEQQPLTTTDTSQVCSSTNDATAATICAGDPNPDPGIAPVSPGKDNGVPSFPSDMNDGEILDSEIPGLHSSVQIDDMQHAADVTHLSSADTRTEQEPNTSSGCTFSLDFQPSGSTSTCRSEAHSPNVAITDSIQTALSTSVALPSQYLLPKMSVTIVDLTDEQKDHMQKLAFVRIIEAYKQIAVAGGSHFRFSLLAHLGVEVVALWCHLSF